jgi:hypothetical protein
VIYLLFKDLSIILLLIIVLLKQRNYPLKNTQIKTISAVIGLTIVSKYLLTSRFILLLLYDTLLFQSLATGRDYNDMMFYSLIRSLIDVVSFLGLVESLYQYLSIL